MNKLLPTCLLSLCLLQPAFAAEQAAAPVSDASVKQLLKITESNKIIDETMQNVDAMVMNSLRRAIAGQKLSPDDMKVIDGLRAKLESLLKADLTWEKFEPQVAEIYKKTFSQEEIDGMVAFYQSKAGQAMISKMPQVMDASMKAMQETMAPVMPKITELRKQAVEQLKTK